MPKEGSWHVCIARCHNVPPPVQGLNVNVCVMPWRGCCWVLPLLWLFLSAAAGDACWRSKYFRAPGRPVSVCDASKGYFQSGWRCYPCCDEATPPYKGIGPLCVQECKPGEADLGVSCRTADGNVTYSKAAYGRGAGKNLGCRIGDDEDEGLCYTPCRCVASWCSLGGKKIALRGGGFTRRPIFPTPRPPPWPP